MKALRLKKGQKIFAADFSLKTHSQRNLIGTFVAFDGKEYFKIHSVISSAPHRWLPQCWVDSVDEEGVYLNKTEDEIRGGAFEYPPPR